jgi:hypothetical protein
MEDLGLKFCPLPNHYLNHETPVYLHPRSVPKNRWCERIGGCWSRLGGRYRGCRLRQLNER